MGDPVTQNVFAFIQNGCAGVANNTQPAHETWPPSDEWTRVLAKAVYMLAGACREMEAAHAREVEALRAEVRAGRGQA